MKIKLLLLAMILISLPVLAAAQTKAELNAAALKSYWYAQVSDAAYKYKTTDLQLDEKDPKIIMAGIPILLSFQHDRSNGSTCYSRTTDRDPATQDCFVEVTALYHISKLYYGDEIFADSVDLTDSKKFNTPEIVAAAYDSYRAWFKKVEKIGLEKARKRKLAPLKGEKIEWYGGDMIGPRRGIEIDVEKLKTNN